MADIPQSPARQTALRAFDRPPSSSPHSGGHAQAHTRFVRRMRLVLPLAAFALVAVLFAWPRMNRTLEPLRSDKLDGGPAQGRNEVLNPRFESRDEDRQPYTVTASRAVQSTQNPDEIILDTPLADLTLKTGKWIAVESHTGTFDQKKRFLRLEGNVKLYHDDGYELRTASVNIDLAGRTLDAPGPVAGQGPLGSVEATGGLHAQATTGKLVLKGPARLILNRAPPGF